MSGVFPARNLAIAMATAWFLWLMGFTVMSACVISFLGFLRMGGLQFFMLVYRTLPRDLWLVMQVTKVAPTIKRDFKENLYVSDHFQETAQKYPNKVAIVFENRKMTFKELDEVSNKIANMLRASTNLQHGDVMAVFMKNCMEYIWISLALSKIGVTAALVNYNLHSDSLAHCIRIANCSGVFFNSTLSDAIAEVLPNLAISDMLYCVGGDCSIPRAKSLEAEIDTASPANPPPVEGKSLLDIMAYMYTSGTTGLPKACKIPHRKYCVGCHILRVLSGVVPEDVVYITLPIYHGTGGIVGLSQMVIGGSTIVLREKFSASNFWSDCIKYNCTVCFYIGELCRYVLCQPKRPVDTQHSVRLMIGNGLRAQIWSEFTKRFRIAQILEFYASTEGNIGFLNPFNKVGACGFFSMLFPFLNRGRLIKIDPQNGEYVRDSKGFCVEAGVNEPGEVVGMIIKDPNTHFDGYTDPTATKKKVMKDVFVAGDQFFLSGDILRKDEDGFLYFCDRIGDTFRWKGENVSTTEVEAMMANILQLRDVVVYGVEVPGNEGRAGMAAIVGTRESVDLSGLAQQLFLSLPNYAVPLFIRLVPSVDLTGTFKLKKAKLRNEGFDISLPDPLYILDTSSKTYVPLTEEMYQKLENEELRI